MCNTNHVMEIGCNETNAKIKAKFNGQQCDSHHSGFLTCKQEGVCIATAIDEVKAISIEEQSSIR